MNSPIDEAPPQWENPFAEFLSSAYSERQKIRPEHEVHSNPKLLASFVKLSEDRSFVFDIMHRVQTLATSLDRMRLLSEAYIRCQRRRDSVMAVQAAADPTRTQFEIPDEVRQEEEGLCQEANVLTAFLYYEMSAIIGLTKPLLTPPPRSALSYLVCVRDKILVHGKRDGRTKNSRSVITVGPILHTHLVGGETYSSTLKNWYVEELDTSLKLPIQASAAEAAANAQLREIADQKGIEENVSLILGKRWADKFTPKDILRLKAYGLREPDLLEGVREIASLLTSKFLPEIRRVCEGRSEEPKQIG